jgi:outer membrane protein assembly factor BamA
VRAQAQAQGQALDPGKLTLQPLDAPLKLNAADTIVEIKVEGARRTEPDAIRRVLRNKVGRAFDSALTAEVLKAVWGLRYF